MLCHYRFQIGDTIKRESGADNWNCYNYSLSTLRMVSGFLKDGIFSYSLVALRCYALYATNIELYILRHTEVLFSVKVRWFLVFFGSKFKVSSNTKWHWNSITADINCIYLRFITNVVLICNIITLYEDIFSVCSNSRSNKHW